MGCGRKRFQGLTAATFPPTLYPCFLYVSLLRTASSVGNATIVPEVSFPMIAGNDEYLYSPCLCKVEKDEFRRLCQAMTSCSDQRTCSRYL